MTDTGPELTKPGNSPSRTGPPDAATLADRSQPGPTGANRGHRAVNLIVAGQATNCNPATTDTAHPSVDLAVWPAVRRTATP